MKSMGRGNGGSNSNAQAQGSPAISSGDRSDHAAHDMTLGGHVARLASGVAAPLEAQRRESRSRIGERALAERSAPPKPTAAYVTTFTR